VKINSIISRQRSGSRKERDQQEAYSNNISVSSVIKRKGNDRHIVDFLTIKESKVEIEENSGPDSPYFSSSVKGLRSNKLEDTSNVSEQPLNGGVSFQKKYSHVASKFNNRLEMNIQDYLVNNHSVIKVHQDITVNSSEAGEINYRKSKTINNIDNALNTQLVFPIIPYKNAKKDESQRNKSEEKLSRTM
jgi:hypothetical protein